MANTNESSMTFEGLPNNKGVTNKRDLSIDATRGFALFMVVLSHATHLPHLFTDFYIIAFFFVSGWLYKPGKEYGKNIQKKANRVLVPYFVNSMILLLCYVFLNTSSLNLIIRSLEGIGYSRYVIREGGVFLMTIGNSPLWYLTAFFTASIIFHAAVDRCRNNHVFLLYFIITSLLASEVLSKAPILLPWCIDMAPYFSIVMVLGYLIKESKIVEDNVILITLLLLVYVFLSIENGGINLSIRHYGGGQVTSLLSGIACTIFLLGFFKLIERVRVLRPLNAFFVLIGKNSIVVLSYHLLLFDIFKRIFNLLPNFLIGPEISVFQHARGLIIVLLSLLTCIAIGILYEKVRAFHIDARIEKKQVK